MGITGVESRYTTSLDAMFERIHKHITLPAIAGFGISEPEHAAQMVKAGADGVITGSRLVQLIQQAEKNGWDMTPIVEHTRQMLKTVNGMQRVKDLEA